MSWLPRPDLDGGYHTGIWKLQQWKKETGQCVARVVFKRLLIRAKNFIKRSYAGFMSWVRLPIGRSLYANFRSRARFSFSRAALGILLMLWASPAAADVAIGGACTSSTAQSAQATLGGNNVVCASSLWRYPPYQLGARISSCGAGKAGMAQWNAALPRSAMPPNGTPSIQSRPPKFTSSPARSHGRSRATEQFQQHN